MSIQSRKDALNLEYGKKWCLKGVCDERYVIFCATAKRLPGGGFGGVVIALKGDELRVYDAVGMKMEPGELVLALPLKDMEGFQRTGGMLGELIKGYSFRFTCRGEKYVFANCAMQKAFLDAVEQAVAAAKRAPLHHHFTQCISA